MKFFVKGNKSTYPTKSGAYRVKRLDVDGNTYPSSGYEDWYAYFNVTTGTWGYTARLVNVMKYANSDDGELNRNCTVGVYYDEEPVPTILVKDDVIKLVQAELERARTKFPTWPTDPIHAVQVLNEEVGELNKEILQMVYEPHKTSKEKIQEEAIQAAAMALRFIESLNVYEYSPGKQHKQK